MSLRIQPLSRQRSKQYYMNFSFIVAIAVVLLRGAARLQAQGFPSSPDDNWDTQFTLSGVHAFVSGGAGALAVVYMGADLYVGGDFGAVGHIRANSVARWDGAGWHALGEGIPTQGEKVYAMAVVGTNLYVGGDFKVAGDQYANGIARWDGTAWHPLGVGISNGVTDSRGAPMVVKALLALGGDLYVGGSFAKAGGVPALGVAKWNGTTWSPLGGGIPRTGGLGVGFNAVYALGTDGLNLYVGGYFSQAGDVSAANIAKWNGSEWSALGGGLVGNHEGWGVNSIIARGSDVYASGAFDSAVDANGFGFKVPGFARWDGRAWAAVTETQDGGRIDSTISAFAGYTGGSLLLHSNEVYMSGNFIYPDGSGKSGIARLRTNAVWEIVASGIGFPRNLTQLGPYAVQFTSSASDGNRIALAGDFLLLNDESASGVVQWDGKVLSSLKDGGGNGLSFAASAIAASGTNLYAGVIGGLAGATRANGIGRWDGVRWSALGEGVRYFDDFSAEFRDGAVYAIAPSGGDVYVGGYFSVAGSDYANSVAKWDGAKWSGLGAGLKNGVSRARDRESVQAIAVLGPEVYVGGMFDHAGGLPVNSIARWNAIHWSPLGSGVDGGEVKSLAVGRDGLYVGGSFGSAGGVASPNIARWDGQAWQSVGGGSDGSVYTVVSHAGEIYVAGDFLQIGGVPARTVAKWNGTNWLGFPSLTYIAGDSTAWELNRAGGLAFDGDDLYISGAFTNPLLGFSAPTLTGIAKWTRHGWVLLGHGIGFYDPRLVRTAPTPPALAIINKSLFVAGNAGYSFGSSFDLAGNKLSLSLARYNLAFDFTRPVLNLPRKLANGSLKWSATNVNALTAALEGTTDFARWTPSSTNEVVMGSVAFTNADSFTFPRRFYRLALP